MIYIFSTLTIIILLAVYSFSSRRRNIEELEFKKNMAPMNIWEHSMKTRGNKNV
jgi:hypothetical protein